MTFGSNRGYNHNPEGGRAHGQSGNHGSCDDCGHKIGSVALVETGDRQVCIGCLDGEDL